MSSTNSTSAPVRIASVPGILGNVSTLRQISQARVLCASRSASLDATAVSVSASSSFRLMALRTAASDGNADPNMHNDVSAAAATEKSCLCAFPAASAPPSPWTVLAALAPASAQPNSCATTALADARMAAAWRGDVRGASPSSSASSDPNTSYSTPAAKKAAKLRATTGSS